MLEAYTLKGVGPAVQKRLQSLGITSLRDLLYHFPTRYDDFSTVTTIADAPLDTPLTIAAKVEKVGIRRSWQRKRFTLVEATVSDATGSLKLVWFNQPFIAEQLKVNDQLLLSGKVKQTKYGQQMVSPAYEKAKAHTMHTARLVPHYPTTYGITQKQLRFFITQALELIKLQPTLITEWLPQHIVEEYDLLPLTEALRQLHYPENEAEIKSAKYRLGFDELLLMQLLTLSIKHSLADEQAHVIPLNEANLQHYTKALPFELTHGQRVAAWEIIQDLEHTKPMNRLLEGDVGAGKTVVAGMALYATAKSGFQGVLMAPTEVLAEQHFAKLSELLAPFKLRIALVTNHLLKLNTGGQDTPLSSKTVACSTADIIVGTHALISVKPGFPRLALAVVDEQHRFGVKQRQQLKLQSGLKLTPHLLSMTATPIPRTLALTAYGELDLSIINELPKNRKPINTTLIQDSNRAALYSHLNERLLAHEQVFVVAPRIEDEEESEKTSVEREFKRLQIALPQARMAMLHGQLKAKDKQAIMQSFRDGEIELLVSTTVIEVGVDIPNATIMVIENAEQFGLAQLHQLRGRVGRSNKPSWCYVCTESTSKNVIDRLDFFAATRSGFELAEYDLERRGPGDVYGQQQSGFSAQFKIARLTDSKLVKATQTVAATLFPHLDQYALVQEKLEALQTTVHLE